ncbi:MAG: YhdH/YhfP family quinone oxidoreductase [Bdellovibrionales bacterium]|nr:YhdH/YhfP family quinone oxidoreductase [Bdellovibrionales bacterium]
MKCLLTRKDPYKSEITDIELPEIQDNEVQIRVEYSSLNYKDALAITGKGRILKSFPLVPGIDASGVIEKSRSEKLKEGEAVLVTGCGLGENLNGGYAEFIQVPDSWVIPLPESLSSRDAMIYGTAGFTAGLCLMRMEQMDQSPELGPVLISGASGGVGSLATAILSTAGYEVHACTSKPKQAEALLGLGAKQTLHPSKLIAEPSKPLESAQYAGAIDNLGGDMLHALMARTKLWGNVACVGLAMSHELQSTVMPLILRGVSLLGISSANTPRPMRERLWQKLATQWKPEQLENIVSRELSLEELLSAAPEMIANKTFGRSIVKIC